MTWAPIDLEDNARTRNIGNAVDASPATPDPPTVRHDEAAYDHGPAVWRVLAASGGTPRTP
jgi:hypothetical protein